jgi:hypothetical protein
MKFFTKYIDFLSLNEDLSREKPGLFGKMSAYTIMHLLIWKQAYKHIARKESGVVKHTYMEQDSPALAHSLESVDDELMIFMHRYQDYFDKNFKLIAHSSALTDDVTKTNLKSVLKKYPAYYVYWDSNANALADVDDNKFNTISRFFYIFGSTYKKLMLVRKDNFYDPNTILHGTNTINKVSVETVQELLVDSSLAPQSMVDNIWEKRIEKDPTNYKKAESVISKKLKDKYKHLDISFDLLDDD